MRTLQSLPAIVVVFLPVFLAGCRAGQPDPLANPETGVSLELAAYRAKTIRDLRYELAFTVPAVATDPINGKAVARFNLLDTSHPVVLDFEPGTSAVQAVSTNGRPIAI